MPPFPDPDAPDTFPCTGCGVGYEASGYYYANGNRQARCRSCQLVNLQAYYSTRVGFEHRMWNNTMKASRERSALGRASGHTLTFGDIEAMAREQQDRCYLSGHPMTFAARSDWQASVERLDNSLDYSRENCRLICLEFNTA
ncbi:hypothetical protein JKP88DRAFT_161277, partial [Tribonema minus]